MWSCSRCTFYNRQELLCCEVCGGQRSLDVVDLTLNYENLKAQDLKPPLVQNSNELEVVIIEDAENDRNHPKEKFSMKSGGTPPLILDLTDDSCVRYVPRAFSPAPCRKTLRQIRRQHREDEALARSLQKLENDEYVASSSEPTYDVLQDHRRNIKKIVNVKANGIRVVSVEENPHAKVGTKLYTRFVESWQLVQDQSVELAFHGTAECNISSICERGFDPTKRSGQAMGPGEYFAELAQVAHGYCKGGKKMLVVALLLDKTGLTTRANGIFVIHKPEYQLPLFIVTFQ